MYIPIYKYGGKEEKIIMIIITVVYNEKCRPTSMSLVIAMETLAFTERNFKLYTRGLN